MAALVQPQGPPRRRITKSAEMLTDNILRCKSPTYYNVGRAWIILGYHQAPKPTVVEFIGDVGALWKRQATLTTLRGRRARASMLDALRTLGFRDAKWNTNMHELFITANHQDGSWAMLPDPPRGYYNSGKEDAREYLAATAPRAAPTERYFKDTTECITWRELHRYYGFTVRDATGTDVHLRAFPVPRGADSLWHSLS